MKRYITKERVLWVLALVFFVLCLSSCKIDYNSPLNTFKQENSLFEWVLVWPIGWVMYQIGHFFNDSFAWGVIFTTIIIRTIAWPVYAKTNDMSLKMQVAQPEINRLQQKYATRKDPESQQKMQMEMMAIYKKYKINFLGCLMPLIQMPLFMAMYTVVKRITVEGGKYTLTNQKLFGVFDLSMGVYGSKNNAPLWSGSMWCGIVLSIIVGGTMFLSTWLSQKKPKYVKNVPAPVQSSNQPDMGKSMKIMNYIMIGMMVIVALQNNGLALYWVIGNIYSLGQMVLNRYLNEKKYYKLKEKSSII